MKVNPIPDGYHTVTPYIVVNGATSLIEFLKKTFDAKELSLHQDPDGRVMHCEMMVGNSIVLIGEPSPGASSMPMHLYVYVTDTDATYKKALDAGGISVMEPADQFYGDRNAGVKDTTGNSWWIGTRVENVSPEEMKKREEEFMKKMKG